MNSILDAKIKEIKKVEEGWIVQYYSYSNGKSTIIFTDPVKMMQFIGNTLNLDEVDIQ